MQEVAIICPRVIDKFEVEDIHILVLEFCDQTLNEYLLENRNLTLKQQMDLIKKLAYFVKVLHDHHIIHTDLKFENVMLKKRND